MNKFWKKVEHYNAKLIPLALILLLFIIIFELFIHLENHGVELTVHILDYLVITIFVIDLTFLAIKAKSVKFFFKNYWLDIIAVFPFIIFFNIINSVYRAVIAAERFVLGQAILHETVEAGKGVKLLSKTGGKAGKFIRIAARSIRVITKSRFFTKFRAKHRSARKKLKGGKRG